MRTRLTTLAAPVATATLALGTAAWAATGDLPLEPGVPASAVTAQATGPLIVNDRDGSAILSAGALAPGQIATGEVTISNAGDAAGAFTLSTSAALDTGAPIGSALSGVLDLTVKDVSTMTPVTLFAGKLNALPRLALGTFAAGAAHRYRFELTYPGNRIAAVDNAFQGASASVEFDWDAVAVGGSSLLTPTPLPAGSSSNGPSHPPSTPGATGTTPALAGSGAAPGTKAGTFKVALGGAKRPVSNGRLVTWMSSSTAARARVTGTVTWAGHKSVKLPPATVMLGAKRRTVQMRLPAIAVRGTKRRLTVRLSVTATVGARQATIRRTLRVTSR